MSSRLFNAAPDGFETDHRPPPRHDPERASSRLDPGRKPVFSQIMLHKSQVMLHKRSQAPIQLGLDQGSGAELCPLKRSWRKALPTSCEDRHHPYNRLLENLKASRRSRLWMSRVTYSG